MLKIGLTGGIGSGKSTVAKMFEVLDIPVYYADAEAKRIINTDTGLIVLLKQHFGEEVYVNNELNRPFLAQQVFGNKYKLDLLNSIVHPATIRDAAAWMEKQTSPYVIKEAALIFESGADERLDYVIGVFAPAALRIKRVMDRDGVSSEEVIKRMNGQINDSLKMKLCDFIINNDERQLVIPQVLKLHQHFLSLL